MNDYELIKRFKAGASIQEIASAADRSRANIEMRLRAIMVGIELGMGQQGDE